MELVPLTLEDALHPEDGDHIVHSDSHDDDLNYLKNVFKSLLADDSQAVVLSDCGSRLETYLESDRFARTSLSFSKWQGAS